MIQYDTIYDTLKASCGKLKICVKEAHDTGDP